MHRKLKIILRMNLDQKKDFLLINSTLPATEANALLIHLINNKINYHNLDDFSHFVRKERNIEFSKKRIIELNEIKNSLKTFLDNVNKMGFNVSVKMTISLEVSK